MEWVGRIANPRGHPIGMAIIHLLPRFQSTLAPDEQYGPKGSSQTSIRAKNDVAYRRSAIQGRRGPEQFGTRFPARNIGRKKSPHRFRRGLRLYLFGGGKRHSTTQIVRGQTVPPA